MDGEGIERRSCSGFPFKFPIHLMGNLGQIIIGTTQNIGSNGLMAEVAKRVEKNIFVAFKFSH